MTEHRYKKPILLAIGIAAIFQLLAMAFASHGDAAVIAGWQPKPAASMESRTSNQVGIVAPMLQGATCGTIGPQGADANDSASFTGCHKGILETQSGDRIAHDSIISWKQESSAQLTAAC